MRAFVQRGLLVLLILAGCVAPGSKFGVASRSLPPPQAGMARMFVYRTLQHYETTNFANVQLNGQGAGSSANGSVFYRDLPPGQYSITISATETYPNQFKTVVLRPGETAFVRIESLSSWSACTRLTNCYPTFVVRLVDPARALGEMQSLALIAG